MIELVTNDRVVGGLTPDAAERARDLYAAFCRGEILLTDAVTAETTKLVENSFRDVNIAFANELSLIADKLHIDVWELIRLANRHPRVNILQPGPGVGGHCIAVDPWFLVDAAPDRTELIRTARQINDRKPEWLVEQVIASVADHPAPTIAALGLAFKADIDDQRESPARRIVARISDMLPDSQIVVVDPHIGGLPAELAERPNITLIGLDTAVRNADFILGLVDHAEFKSIDWSQIAANPERVIDAKGVWA
jgi:UDP-N-acetyl-D-mannosaminuronic acid dehydrogenase